MTISNWKDLFFWQTGENQVIEETLADIKKFNPGKRNLYRAMRETPLDKVRVAIFGQDPYPDPKHATGVAFHTDETPIPPTLRMILQEYHDDLGYPIPEQVNLLEWCKKGVMLWNAIPSCLPFKSLSHDWTEWEQLNQEIVRVLIARGVVLVGLGSVAGRYLSDVPGAILASHPSPRGNMSKRPFLGSRVFSRVNAALDSNNPIDWRL